MHRISSRAPNSFHLHQWPAVDQALTAFPDTTDQTTGIQAILDPALTIIGPRPTAGGASPGGICVEPLNGGQLTVRMDTIMDGHMFPSGASQDRRSWLEVIVYDANNTVLFSSGVVPDNMDPEEINDPIVDCSGAGLNACSGFWDRTFKADGSPASFFWEFASEQSKLLKPPVTFDTNAPNYDHSTTAAFALGAAFLERRSHHGADPAASVRLLGARCARDLGRSRSDARVDAAHARFGRRNADVELGGRNDS